MAINKETLSDQIYNELKRSIIDGKIGFGEKLINRRLQEKYGVSSTPVRDAINRLYLDGLVDQITNSGARIVDFDLKFMLNINEMISLLCGASVELAAKRADRDALCAELEKNIRRQEAALGSDKFYQYDEQFHRIFFRHCGNTECLKCYEQYHVLWEMLVRRFHYFQQEQAFSIDQHKAIYQAFCQSDFMKALALMQGHFNRGEEMFRRHMG